MLALLKKCKIVSFVLQNTNKSDRTTVALGSGIPSSTTTIDYVLALLLQHVRDIQGFHLYLGVLLTD